MNQTNNNITNNLKKLLWAVAVITVVATVVSCAAQKKIKALSVEEVSAKIAPIEYRGADTSGIRKRIQQQQDTIKIVSKVAGKEEVKEQPLVAYRTGDGEAYAEDVLDEVIVEATFKNIAERNGKVDLAFTVHVPKKLQDSKWQVRFYPQVEIMGDREEMEPIFVTGAAYRKAQLRGYEQYNKFLSRIVADTTIFVDVNMLEMFLQRNIPQIYAFKDDTTRVSDEVFASYYGVTEQEAIEHYTYKIARKLNRWRKSKRESRFAKYVKVPILDKGVRLDTVVVGEGGTVMYTYVQTINTRPKLKKASIDMVGKVYKEDEMIYKTPLIGPIDFYISSISSFVDNLTVRYKTQVIERRAEDNKEYQIDFAKGKSDLDLLLNNNGVEINKVQKHLASLVDNKEYDLDSIIVSAAASPEGTVAVNNRLSQRRSVSLVDHFQKYLRRYRDSLARAEAAEASTIFEINLDSTFVDESAPKVKPVDIKFTPRSLSEDWSRLRLLIEMDTIIPQADKEKIFEMYEIKNEDSRELKMRSVASYDYIRKDLYPLLRNVKFKFYMHRKGMIKDTIHTTIIDSVYMAGVQAIRDMDYNRALTLLVDYQDYNTAVVYTSMNRNISALQILEKLEKTAQVNYLLGIIYAREGRIEEAVKHYMDSCRQNPQYIHRGNLDPEISDLIKAYNLHEILYKEQEEEDMLL